MRNGKKVIACDFDGTLARYDGWKGALHFGAPIPAMVQTIRKHLDAGDEVEIFTARAAGDENTTPEQVVEAIKKYCTYCLGQPLEVTNIKHSYFDVFYDDRAVQVIKNTGRRVLLKEPK